MSADNWRVCPQCVADLRVEAEAAKAQVDVSYGKVSLAEFDLIRKRADELQQKVTAAETGDVCNEAMSFREDYSIYTNVDGKLHISYSGYCTQCGYGVDYKHEQEFTPKKKSTDAIEESRARRGRKRK